MGNLTIAVFLLALSCMAAAGSSSAEDLTELSIEELLEIEVISASRLGQKANQAPTSLSVLTSGDIRTFGWRTLAEALNALRGINTSNDRNYSYIGVRGFSQFGDFNSRVLFMIDGQRMNENLYDGGYLGQEFMLDMDMVERIEYIPGSGASIYGANAFTGLINVVTKNGRSIDGVQLAGEAGSYDSYKARASYGKKTAGGADVLLSASHYDSAGVPSLYYPEFDHPDTNNGIAKNMDGERAERLFGRVQYQDFTMMAGLVDRFKRVPIADGGIIFNDQDYHSLDQQYFGNFKYQKALNDKTSVQLRGSYQGYDYNGTYPYKNADNLRVLNLSRSHGRWWTGDAQLTSTYFDGQRLLMGLEYQFDERQQLLNYDLNPYASYQNSNRSGSRVQLYGQDDIQILDDVIFSAGLRLDYTHMLKNLQLNPRLGLIWNALNNTTFKLLYSTNFRAPNVWENDYNFGQPGLLEERIRSYEGIVEWRSANGLKLIGNLFYNDMYQILQANPDTFITANTGHFHTLGAEFEAEQRWSNGRLLKASYTYSLLTDVMQNNAWGYGSPQNMLKFHYAEPLFNNLLKLGVESIFIGDRRALQGGYAHGYDLFNLHLSSDRLAKGLFTSIGVYNVLDNQYQMLGGTGPNDVTQNLLPMNGREFRLKLQLTF